MLLKTNKSNKKYNKRQQICLETYTVHYTPMLQLIKYSVNGKDVTKKQNKPSADEN